MTVWAEVGVGAAWEALVTTGSTHASSRAPCQGLLDECDLLGDVSSERADRGSEK